MSQQDDTMMSEEHTLIISTHYSVADGWSMGVLFRDLSRAYNMLKLGQGASLFIAYVSQSITGAGAFHQPKTNNVCFLS